MGKATEIEPALPGIHTRAILVWPNDENTVDCAEFVTADDGSDYAIKCSDNDARIPHSEWLCARLGSLVGLLSPQSKVVEVRGEECFGSMWETVEPDWWVKAAAKSLSFSDLAGGLSRILAFDLFVHNEDRHLRNYLVRRQRTKHTVLAFDHATAWLCNGIPPPALPMSKDCRTIKVHRFLKDQFGDFISMSDVKHVTSGLRGIIYSQIQAIILSHPENWLTTIEKTAIEAWWNSPARLERIDQIEEGIENGKLL